MRFAVSVMVGLLAMANSAFAQPAPATPSAATKTYSAKDFGRLPFMTGPVLSPNGKNVLTLLDGGDRKVLGIVALDAPGSKPKLVDLRDTDLIEWNWVNDDWFYIRLGDEGMIADTPMYVTRIVGVSADGKTFKPISLRTPGQHADVIWTAEDGTPRVLMTQQKSSFLGLDFWPSVVEADISTGRVTERENSTTGVFNWYADEKGVVRTGFGSDPRTGNRRVLYRSSEKERFTTIDRAKVGDDGMVVFPFGYLPDGKTALAFSDHEGAVALYELELGTMTYGKKIFGVAGYDLENVTLSPNGDAVAGVHLTSNRPRTVWIDPNLAAVQAGLEKALGKEASPRIVSFDRPRKNFIVEVGGPDQAGSLHVYSSETGKFRLLAHQNDSFEDQRLNPVSTIRYKARDGTSIAAVLTLPKGREAKALPLIVLPHGGPYGVRDSETYDWWVQFLAIRGYAVVQPNYRGSGGYGRSFEKLGDGKWGSTMQDDLNDVVTHLATIGTADPKRVCMAGGSYGGYAAMRAAQRDPSLFRCAISFAGVSDLPAIKSRDSSFFYGKQSRAYWKDVAPDLNAVSPINFPDQFGTPILIVHGAKDKRVAVSQSRRMADKLKAAGKPHRYIEQPEGDHHFTRGADRVQFLEEMDAFLKQHNPA
jgi:dipeptidyl aminopeptidase/acylaminoacyl peptidase